MVAEEERAFASREFSAYGIPLEMVTYLRYLVRVILADDKDFQRCYVICKGQGGVEEDDEDLQQGGGGAAGVHLFIKIRG